VIIGKLKFLRPYHIITLSYYQISYWPECVIVRLPILHQLYCNRYKPSIMRNIFSITCFLLVVQLQAQNVGIGTLTPSTPLHLKGPGSHILRVDGTSPYISLYENTDYRGYLWSRGTTSIEVGSAAGTNLPVTISPNTVFNTAFHSNGYVGIGIGTNLPDSRLEILGGQWDLSSTEGDFKIGNATYRLKIGVATGGGGAGDVRIYATGGTNRIILGAGTADVMAVNSAGGGSVIIGGNFIPAAGYKLSIRGKLMCEEMKVQLTADWPDFVFQDNYRMPTISELDKFIKLNHHLPGMPPAVEVEKNGGFHVGELQLKMLQKIEELTLYLIEQDKSIKQLKEENNRLLQLCQKNNR
jgi:hypothetical protein